MIKQKLICFVLLVLFKSLYSQPLLVVLTKSDKECAPGTANISINSGHEPFEILWSNNQSGKTIDNLQHGNYSVKIVDSNFKDTTIFFTIDELECLPVAENHFTPNGDLYNDTWDVGNLSNYPNFDLYVYNRWGQMVHHQQNTFISWDGKSLGVPLPDATYYYIIYLSKSDKHKIVKGSVSILR